MTLKNLIKIFTDQGCDKIYVKTLSANDNSKNQVYLGGSFEVLNILPISSIVTEEAGDWTKERFKASLKFSWIIDEGHLCPAPNSQLILYPKYPEVRFSGFLKACENAPSELMTQRLPGRLLFLSVNDNGIVLGHVVGPESQIVNEFETLKTNTVFGVFKVIEIIKKIDSKDKLLQELYRIYNLDWVVSKSLTRNGIVPCEAPQCGGYTLEAELGITRNGFSEPDFLGWEVKNFGVTNFKNLNSSAVTLFTPEPTDGLYKTKGIEYFIKTYGYPDKNGRPDRMNFGGIHKIGIRHSVTNLELKLVGVDEKTNKIRNTNGRIALIDNKNNEAASWSFASMLLHWNKKHNQACYVPSLSNTTNGRKYKYGNIAIIGIGTDFQLFLDQMANGLIYYDPGIKLEGISSTRPKSKKRSQFRIKSGNLKNLYRINEMINLNLYFDRK